MLTSISSSGAGSGGGGGGPNLTGSTTRFLVVRPSSPRRTETVSADAAEGFSFGGGCLERRFERFMLRSDEPQSFLSPCF